MAVPTADVRRRQLARGRRHELLENRELPRAEGAPVRSFAARGCTRHAQTAGLMSRHA